MIVAGELITRARAAGFASFSLTILGLHDDRVGMTAGASEEIYPASMIKTPLAVAVAVAVDAGRLGWSDALRVTSANLTFNDAPSPLALGAVATVQELVELMLSRSDNVATNVLIDCVGREQASADLAALGFGGTVIRRKLSGSLPLIADPDATGRNTHPAQEAAQLFARLANRDVPGADLICTALASQVWNSKLSAGLAPDDHFAHKTGDTDETSHDGGILTLAGGRRYALAMYTREPSSDVTDAKFASFMRAIRPLL